LENKDQFHRDDDDGEGEFILENSHENIYWERERILEAKDVLLITTL